MENSGCTQFMPETIYSGSIKIKQARSKEISMQINMVFYVMYA